MLSTWDYYFLFEAAVAASKSKDPSTKTGAVIVDRRKVIVGKGYNGFPRFTKDDQRLEDREQKYELIIHADANAILNSSAPLPWCTMYTWPFPPCHRCAGLIVQSGISRVVAPAMSKELRDRWGDSLNKTARILNDASVCFEVEKRSEVMNGMLPYYNNFAEILRKFNEED